MACSRLKTLEQFFVLYFIVPCEKFGSPYPGKAEQPQEQLYRLLLVCAAFSCVQAMVCLPVFRIFNVRIYMMVHAIAHGGCADAVRLCTESWLAEKNPLPHLGLEPSSVLCLVFSRRLPTFELFPPLPFCCVLVKGVHSELTLYLCLLISLLVHFSRDSFWSFCATSQLLPSIRPGCKRSCAKWRGMRGEFSSRHRLCKVAWYERWDHGTDCADWRGMRD